MTSNEKAEKHCRRCDTTKPMSGFARQRRTADGMQAWCKECNADYRRTHRANQKARMEEYKKDPLFLKLKDGVQRARVLAVPAVSSEDLLAYWDANGILADHCYYSGVRLSGDWHLDHKVPLSRGGTHTVDNLVPCTPEVNMQKGRLTADEFADDLT